MLLGSALRPKKNGLATALAFRRLCACHPQRAPAASSGEAAILPLPRAFLPLPRGEGWGEGAWGAASHPQSTLTRPPLAGGLSPGERREPSALVFAEEPEAERQGYRLWGVEGVEVRPACPQGDYWRQAAACGLALHLDYRRTIGRFSAECAALGVPCISTAGATMQRACFPDLIVEPWDVEGAAALAERVLADPAFRAGVVARAARAVEAFDLAPMAARFREALAAVAR